jgi:hypothetical protein
MKTREGTEMTTNSNIPLAMTVPYDPMYPITGKRRVQLTTEEETSYAAAFVASQEEGMGTDSARVAWHLLQEKYPRLREFDVPERSKG